MAYASALAIFLIGTFGLFGQPRDPLAGAFLIPLGLPWSLAVDAAPERHLRLVVSEYVEHCHLERNHQGRDNRLIERSRGQPPDGGRVARRERLGGVLSFYYREAA